MSRMTVEQIRHGVAAFGCEGFSARSVADVVEDYKQSHRYENAFKELLELRRGLLDVGCRNLKSLDGPIQATSCINNLRHEFERPFIAWNEFGAGINILLMIPSPPTLIVKAVATGAAVVAYCLGFYRTYFE